MEEKLEDLATDITNFYTKKIRPDIWYKQTELEKKIWDRWNKMVNSKTFGLTYITNRNKILALHKKLEKWFEKDFEEFQELVEAGVERIIEGAKEDKASEEEESGGEYEPEKFHYEDLDEEEMFQWFFEEWSHNIEGRHWLVKFADSRNLDLHDVKYGGLEDSVIDKVVTPVQVEGSNGLEQIKKVLDEVNKTLEKPKVIKWVFDDGDPIKWQ